MGKSLKSENNEIWTSQLKFPPPKIKHRKTKITINCEYDAQHFIAKGAC